MPPKAKTYAQAVAAAQAMLATARLADPDEHFPYKHKTVVALLDKQPHMGPGVPDGVDGEADPSRGIDDYMSRGIADASRDYIDAQATYLADPSEENRAAYDAARDRLVAARLDHRANRGEGFTVGAAAKRS